MRRTAHRLQKLQLSATRTTVAPFTAGQGRRPVERDVERPSKGNQQWTQQLSARYRRFWVHSWAVRPPLQPLGSGIRGQTYTFHKHHTSVVSVVEFRGRFANFWLGHEVQERGMEVTSDR
jgi:hypothetical protein